LFKPSPETGRNGTYNAIIRFVPWHKDSKKSLITKWSVFLEEPISGKKRSVDCPSSINEKSVLKDVFFKLFKSNSVREKELAEKFKRKKTCYSLVYIVKDENAPENEGKLMVFKFGTKIYDKITNEMAPPVLSTGRQRKPFDLFIGRPFSLIVTKKGGYTNYDDSYFLDEPWPLRINGKEISKETTDPADILNWLKDNSPNLDAYQFKEWDDQTREFVNEVIKNTVPNGSLIGSISPATREVKLDTPATPSKKSQTVKAEAKSIDIEEDITTLDSDDSDVLFDDDDDDFYAGLE
jgi:NADH:ubiquinone oxidoreductase subunit